MPESFETTTVHNKKWKTFSPTNPDFTPIQIPVKKLKVKIGTLEVELDVNCYGKVMLDGKEMPCRAFTIHCEIDKSPIVVMELIPKNLELEDIESLEDTIPMEPPPRLSE